MRASQEADVVEGNLRANVVVHFLGEEEIILHITAHYRFDLANFILCSGQLHDREPIVLAYRGWLVLLRVLKHDGILLLRKGQHGPITWENLL